MSVRRVMNFRLPDMHPQTTRPAVHVSLNSAWLGPAHTFPHTQHTWPGDTPPRGYDCEQAKYHNHRRTAQTSRCCCCCPTYAFLYRLAFALLRLCFWCLVVVLALRGLVVDGCACPRVRVR